MFQVGHHRGERHVGRMAATDANADALCVMRLRILATTARAMATGVTNVALGRASASTVVLHPGDAAPEFSLQASDGVTYRLADYLGRTPVVIAWFPKAFTGGCTAECRSRTAHAAAFPRSTVPCFGATVAPPA